MIAAVAAAAERWYFRNMTLFSLTKKTLRASGRREEKYPFETVFFRAMRQFKESFQSLGGFQHVAVFRKRFVGIEERLMIN